TQLRSYPLQQPFGRLDAFFLAQLASLIFDTDVPTITRILNELKHFPVVDIHLVTLLIKLIRFCAYALGKWHQVFNPLVAVVLVEVSEIRQAAAVTLTHALQYGTQPVT